MLYAENLMLFALESDATGIMNNATLLRVLMQYITRLEDVGTLAEPESLESCQNFNVLLSIKNLVDFKSAMTRLEKFCSSESMKDVSNDSSLHKFLQAEKEKCCRQVGLSEEYRMFKAHLKEQHRTRQRCCCC